MRLKFRLPLLLAQATLVVAVALQVEARLNPPPPARVPDLAAAVPAVLDGWQVKDEPLGTSAEGSAWVAQTLNYDQAVQRIYRQGTREFTIFAAYWNRGKMPARSVSIHTPDCCWTSAGYKCKAMKFRQVLAVPETRLQPAEWRIFDAPTGETTQVLFWQIAGREPFEFGEQFGGAGNPWLNLKAFVRDAMLGCREELFVTISTNVSTDDLLADPGFQTALRELGKAGLDRPAPGAE